MANSVSVRFSARPELAPLLSSCACPPFHFRLVTLKISLFANDGRGENPPEENGHFYPGGGACLYGCVRRQEFSEIISECLYACVLPGGLRYMVNSIPRL